MDYVIHCLCKFLTDLETCSATYLLLHSLNGHKKYRGVRMRKREGRREEGF